MVGRTGRESEGVGRGSDKCKMDLFELCGSVLGVCVWMFGR